MTTRNQTRPNCAKVKIEVDLIAKLPQKIRITEEDDVTGVRITEEDDAAEEFYIKQFTKQADMDYFEMLNELPIVINGEEKEQLQGMSLVDEVKETVIRLNKNGAGGSDRMTGTFNQQTWDITGEDMYSIRDFFGGAELPKFITHRNLVLISKKVNVNTFSDLIPISLKFVQGRSIAENVLLVQEIIAEIRKEKPSNLVVKLDMIKAYDRVEWIFMTKGDPLSPTLFILATKVMSRSLNALMEKKDFKRFGMPRGSLKVNHLAFADDMIITCKAEVRTMQMITDTLKRYEDTSGQKINKEKSVIYMHHSIAGGEAVIVEVATRILRKEFPFTYLGCPIFY
ncbi:uncharacterized protein LOC129900203 [Solanum dulcamara]|uniref:uncharacterized protein LOC129900203 n=1 Tax=Solanum dulcamara TaxID=45834 RepID=UPI0024851EC4|nr:uncharacterized protein LOC129900203 [Solanum dulcamara]